MATAGLFSLLITWWASPIDQALALAGQSAPIGEYRIDPLVFGVRGIAPIGYAAFALALGVPFGVLIRRTLPAMAATLASFAAIQVAWANLIRPHLISPKVASHQLGPQNLNEFIISDPSQIVTVVGSWRPPGGWVLSNQAHHPGRSGLHRPGDRAPAEVTPVLSSSAWPGWPASTCISS